MDTIKNKAIKEYLSGKRVFSEINWILDNLTECLNIYDSSGELIYQNAASKHWFNPAFEDGEVIVFRDMDGGLLKEENKPFNRAIRGEAFTNYNVQVVHEERGKNLFSFNSAPFVDQISESGLLVTVVTARNITK